ncbi:hypothetical protein [Nocardia pneumoniae]|uniref:hypothetical protein n=1 Tax=Nocardia pneumoniae TaxID=228601 RepID=UPI00059512F6|nr:hypothetical protein [Nocardia pneumoniae]
MAIDIVLQAQDHSPIASADPDPTGILGDLCAEAPQGTLLQSIHPHADTMFNAYQLKTLVTEIDTMLARSESHRPVWEGLRSLAIEAIQCRGYLWFSGD